MKLLGFSKVLVVVLTMFSISLSNLSALNSEDDKKIKEIALYMNSSEEQVLNDIDSISSRNPNVSRETIIAKLYEEVVVQTRMESVAPVYQTPNNLVKNSNTFNPLNSSSINYDNVKLPNQAAGRHFYVPSKTAHVWNHGHSGIYVNTTQIIHAPGGDKKVEIVNANALSAPKGSKVVSVNNANAQWGAVAWAKGKLGYKYNSSVDNMMCDRNSFNCSQLVYCAFKSQGISLSNGSWNFVSPADLVKDKDVKMTTWSR